MNNPKEKRLRVELHCHTIASHDSLLRPKKILARCDQIGIDKVAITDHNSIEAALICASAHPERVIVGEEIQTDEGEILGYFLSQWVPPGLSPMETIQRLREQGAVISIPHPFDPYRGNNWKAGSLQTIAPYVDAIEIFNARCMSDDPNQKAATFAKANQLLSTVGSDAHCVWELGRATLRLPDFWDTASFKTALKNAQPSTNLSSMFVHLYSRFATIWKGISENASFNGTCE